MQFVVIGRDGTDTEALKRRMAAREAHIALTDQYLKAETGNMVFAAALLNERQEMCGSVMIVDFESREKLDEWLAIEPYVIGDVWRSIEVEECRVGPSFTKKSTE